ncbi:hypothetical protein [Streptomyces sp. MST-110588]|uniref:hypothetical protein n=1 Tax=Streptomyces sp. MST-110588 TaxID=2833628 RepID=UPI001F5CD592|nr:hypothetical protein [Streptomyces sp. MST-110588]UNO39747.1 hypothetical protein KGS77_09275 [Streptomyces sp. MST-110588]
MRRAAAIGLAIAGLGLGSLATAAPASANGTAPACIQRNVFTAEGEYWQAIITNKCNKTMRVRVVGTFGPFGCHKLNKGGAYTHRSRWGDYKRTEVC